ncbi:hypothetical protein CW751_08150 [Brumimicrobium salinarum]|uniref:Uncharacterized protein n=1 Tax=Brumimicrobium salinarum TaxID=2058658 RepID=A0A2I0R2B7_9FLAO|nr:hypothetical protein [Brumimicrobium salinarum]PKR80733.1 hypothetical protein CW751_08150 [Brumimicrobium salinarum]
MAKQKGIIKLTGKIGDLSFYKTKDGYLAREKGGVDGERIKNDPAFARTRENGSEFGLAATAGKTLRDAFRPLMMRAADSRITSRLTKVMSSIRKLDTTSARGDRSVGVAIQNQAAKDMLKGFNFNIRSMLNAILYRPITLDPSSGEIEIEDLVPVNHIAAPANATHVSFTAAWGNVNFADGTYELALSNPSNIEIDSTQSTVAVTPTAPPSGSGTDVYILLVEFFQEINGTQYSLNDGGYNALNIVDVV